MTVFFTADLHFCHEKLAINTRPWSTFHEHDAAILENINRTVAKRDTLYILGDVSWRSPGVLLTRIECDAVHLIWGNHDRAGYAKAFISAEDVSEVRIEGDKVWLSHYAHAFWPASHKGSYHLYGHTHAKAEEELDRIWPQRRSMDVGVDNAFRLLGEYRPFSWDEIKGILGKREGHHKITGPSFVE